MGDEGKTACPGTCAGSRGISGGEGGRDWCRMDGRYFLSRSRSGGVRGGRLVDGGTRGGVGEPARGM
jgi:hypothetical protein